MGQFAEKYNGFILFNTSILRWKILSICALDNVCKHTHVQRLNYANYN